MATTLILVENIRPQNCFSPDTDVSLCICQEKLGEPRETSVGEGGEGKERKGGKDGRKTLRGRGERGRGGMEERAVI